MFSVGLMPSSQIYGHLHDLVLSARLPDAGHQASFQSEPVDQAFKLRTARRIPGAASGPPCPALHSLQPLPLYFAEDWAAFLETNGSSLGRLRSNWSRLLGPVSMERMPGNHSLSAQRPQELRLSCQTDGPWCS